MAVTAPTAAEIRAAFPELFAAGLPEASDALLGRLAATAMEIGAVSQNDAEYLTAHLLTLHRAGNAKADGGAGEVSQESVGARSVAYKTQAAEHHEVFFSQSAYGRMHLTLLRTSPRRVMSMRAW